MQGSTQTKIHPLLTMLVTKIAKLKNKLIKSGYSSKEMVDIIFLEFLRLPKIDWNSLQQTTNFYQIKNTYKVDSSSAQVIMRLQKIVPNLQTDEVCKYLLAVLNMSAQDYGFNLNQSSSDSNDSGSGMNRLIIRRSKRRLKKDEKNRKNNEQIKTRKRRHLTLQQQQNRKVQQQVDVFFRDRHLPIIFPYEEFQLQKQIKKVPESSDSQHQ